MTPVNAPPWTGPPAPHELQQVPRNRTARRLEWPHLPREVRTLVEQRLGSRVVDARSQNSGFTPGFASRVTGADGSRLFVKAASKVAQRQFAAAYAEEARKLRLLPASIPAPRLLWVHEDDLWVVLGFEDVAGHTPNRPWVAGELARCLDTLVAVDTTTRSVPAGLALVPLHADLPTLLTGWSLVRAYRPDWPHLDEVEELARSFASLPDADHFVHADARDDNFILADDGRTLLCDWNWPCLGPRWVDTVMLLASAHGDGVDADPYLAAHPLTADVPDDHVDAWLAALCGFMVESDERPVPASSPFLGVHRRWWAAATWSWLAARRSWT